MEIPIKDWFGGTPIFGNTQPLIQFVSLRFPYLGNVLTGSGGGATMEGAGHEFGNLQWLKSAVKLSKMIQHTCLFDD